MHHLTILALSFLIISSLYGAAEPEDTEALSGAITGPYTPIPSPEEVAVAERAVGMLEAAATTKHAVQADHPFESFVFPMPPFAYKQLLEMELPDWIAFGEDYGAYQTELTALKHECEKSVSSCFEVKRRLVNRKVETQKTWNRPALRDALQLAFRRLHEHERQVNNLTTVIPGSLIGLSDPLNLRYAGKDYTPLEDTDIVTVNGVKIKFGDLLKNHENAFEVLQTTWNCILLQHFQHRILFKKLPKTYGHEIVAHKLASAVITHGGNMSPIAIFQEIERLIIASKQLVGNTNTFWPGVFPIINTPQIIRTEKVHSHVTAFGASTPFEAEVYTAKENYKKYIHGKLAIDHIGYLLATFTNIRTRGGHMTYSELPKFLHAVRFFAQAKSEEEKREIVLVNQMLTSQLQEKLTSLQKDQQFSTVLIIFLSTLNQHFGEGRTLALTDLSACLTQCANQCGLTSQNLLLLLERAFSNESFVDQIPLLHGIRSALGKGADKQQDFDSVEAYIRSLQERESMRLSVMSKIYTNPEKYRALYAAWALEIRGTLFYDVINRTLGNFLEIYEGWQNIKSLPNYEEATGESTRALESKKKKKKSGKEPAKAAPAVATPAPTIQETATQTDLLPTGPSPEERASFEASLREAKRELAELTQTMMEFEAQIREKNAELAQAREELEQLRAQLSERDSEITKLSKQTAQINPLKKEIKALSQQILEHKSNLDAANTRHAKEKTEALQQYADHVRTLEEAKQRELLQMREALHREASAHMATLHQTASAHILELQKMLHEKDTALKALDLRMKAINAAIALRNDAKVIEASSQVSVATGASASDSTPQ